MTKNKPNQGARKTETLTLRLDPKAKFLIELMARERRQSITGVVESAIMAFAEQHTTTASLHSNEAGHCVDQTVSLSRLANEIWSTDDSARFHTFSHVAPHLMDYEEQRLREIIYASQVFWLNYPDIEGDDQSEDIDRAQLRKYWDELLAHADATSKQATIVPFEPDQAK
ncbi:hypothetical protein IBA8401_22550 [Pseudomonas syringae]|uniref:hypothetical protein n=1 Tax=Pseudomonas syringae group TaxID=136849 RepID=UPI0022A6FD01|nr:hypothetical protein [Pseudomonas syringae group genomosp. 3]MCZ0949924.1 hypothetical protein [Pseudomonas syringae pv. tomato]